MDFLSDSPVLRWFQSLRCPSHEELFSPFHLYQLILPFLSTIIAAFAVAFVSRALLRPLFSRTFTALREPTALVFSGLFLRYVWFHSFVWLRHFGVVYLEVKLEFCREYVEPGLSTIVALALLYLAWRLNLKNTTPKPSGTADVNGDGGGGDGSNSNNNAAEASTSVSDATGNATGQQSSYDGDIVPCQTHYCQRCGQVFYEAQSMTFPAPLPSSTEQSLPRALPVRQNGSREIRCPNCPGRSSISPPSGGSNDLGRLPSSSLNGNSQPPGSSSSLPPSSGDLSTSEGEDAETGESSKRVHFVVGSSNINDTVPKGIMKTPRQRKGR